MVFRRRAKAIAPEVKDLEGLFRPSKGKAPGPLGYEPHELIDGRPLRPGERERLLSMLQNKSALQWDQGQNEERCAAAYVCACLGIREAIPIIRRMKAESPESPHVAFAFEFASACFMIMEMHGSFPERGGQLMRLLEMRESANPAERRFAQIVLEKAGIKYGTITSW